MNIIVVVAFFMLFTFPVISASAQADEIIQLGLNIQKLNQFRQILSDMKKGYELLSKGYGTVSNLAKGNFKIHEVFLDGLYAISPGVRKYWKIAEILEMQNRDLSLCKKSFSTFRELNVFSVQQLSAIEKVYTSLMANTIKNIDELIIIITPNRLRMNDAERIAVIDRIYNTLVEKEHFLNVYINNTYVSAQQLLAEKNELNRISELLGR